LSGEIALAFAEQDNRSRSIAIPLPTRCIVLGRGPCREDSEDST
jgi:hypothetical protein